MLLETASASTSVHSNAARTIDTTANHGERERSSFYRINRMRQTSVESGGSGEKLGYVVFSIIESHVFRFLVIVCIFTWAVWDLVFGGGNGAFLGFLKFILVRCMCI